MDASDHKNGRRKDHRKFLNGKLHNRKPVEKPRKRWEDVVQRDALEMLGIRGWRGRAGGKKIMATFLELGQDPEGLQRNMWIGDVSRLCASTLIKRAE
jgi:hypothetical protein